VTTDSGDRPPAAARAGRALRRELHAAAGLTVITGGQTGVDTLAAEAALAAGLPVRLIFPAGLLQEDGPLTPPRRARLSGAVLHELDFPDFRYRTWTCAYLADAVILLDPAGGEGCQETARAARGLGRPLLEFTGGPVSAAAVAAFAARADARVLDIAGCRGSVLDRWDSGADLRAEIDAVIGGALLHRDRLRSAGP
jgi:hypothetical protein